MKKKDLSLISPYRGSLIVLTTKHSKSLAIAPVFSSILGAKVLEYVVDTDMLGTFSGEIKREKNALECAREKCEIALEKLGDQVEYALASEGSFGPHPMNPFIACDYEILYFIDRIQGFHMHVSLLSTRTNYCMQAVDSLEELVTFAKKVKFPSHGLILRPNVTTTAGHIFKGINTQFELEYAFNECMKYASDSKVWVETDMRAVFNPTRMKVIKELAIKLAKQLATNCAQCTTPGWGKIGEELGLECSFCGTETECVKFEIYNCKKCCYQEKIIPLDGLRKADPSNCQYCNP
jgi:hypothetical protein